MFWADIIKKVSIPTTYTDTTTPQDWILCSWERGELPVRHPDHVEPEPQLSQMKYLYTSINFLVRTLNDLIIQIF